LQNASVIGEAQQLVTTYSEKMAERLVTVVFPNLQFEQPATAKSRGGELRHWQVALDVSIERDYRTTLMPFKIPN